MSIIAITQVIETSTNVTLSAVAGKIYRVVNTHASNSITVTFGSNTATLAAGVFVDFWYNGSTWRSSTIYVPTSTPYYESYKNILVSRASVSTIAISWTKLQIENVLSGAQSFTLNIADSGVLGLDTGSEAVSTWYYIWAIAKPDETVSAILSASSTSPTMPSGYTLKRLVSTVRNNSSGDFVDFVQQNKTWRYKTPVSVLAGTASQSVITNTDCSAFIPPLTTIRASIYAGITINNSTSGNVLYANVYSGINGQAVRSLYASQQINPSDYGLTDVAGEIDILSGLVATFLYSSAAAVSTWIYMDVHGFEIPL